MVLTLNRSTIIDFKKIAYEVDEIEKFVIKKLKRGNSLKVDRDGQNGMKTHHPCVPNTNNDIHGATEQQRIAQQYNSRVAIYADSQTQTALPQSKLELD